MSEQGQLKVSLPARRTRVPIPVLLRAGEKSGCGLVLNLSESSAFVATSLILRPGSRLHLVVASPAAAQALQIEAEVVWHNHRFFPIFKQLPSGYGIRFDDSDPGRHVLNDLSQGTARKRARSVA